jgi:AP2-like factor (ANT lineage)
VFFTEMLDLNTLNQSHCTEANFLVDSFMRTKATEMADKTCMIRSDWFCATGTQEEAAEAYDIAAIKFRGLNAVTNFDMSRYDVDSILNSDLPVGGGATGRASKFPLDSLQPGSAAAMIAGAAVPPSEKDYWSLLALHYQQQQQQFPASAYEAYGSGVNVDFTMGTSSHSSSNTGSGVMWGATTGAMGQQDSSSSKQGNGYASNIPYAAAAMVSGSAGYEGSTGNNGTWVTSSITSTAPQYYNYLFGME